MYTHTVYSNENTCNCIVRVFITVQLIVAFHIKK